VDYNSRWPQGHQNETGTEVYVSGHPKTVGFMTDTLTPEAREYFRKQGRRGGKIGAKARMEKLTQEQRTEYARNAGKNRWKAQNGTAAALETETGLAEFISQSKKKDRP
jgi:hypothetical protein